MKKVCFFIQFFFRMEYFCLFWRNYLDILLEIFVSYLSNFRHLQYTETLTVEQKERPI